MKIKEIDFRSKCIKYSDLSSDNDEHLQLISSLLLKVDDVLEIKDAKTLGYYLDSYLNKKIILDHCFWERGVELCNLDEEEIENMTIEICNRCID
jgi:hypothetical protein